MAHVCREHRELSEAGSPKARCLEMQTCETERLSPVSLINEFLQVLACQQAIMAGWGLMGPHLP